MSSPFFLNPARDLSISLISPRSQPLALLIFLYFLSLLLISAFTIFFLSVWVLICPNHFSFLPQKLRLLIWNLYFFLLWAFNVINLSVISVLTGSHKVWYVVFSFLFYLMYFVVFLETSLIAELFTSTLFN